MKILMLIIFLTVSGEFVNPICKERGHIMSPVIYKTLMNCPDRLIENDTVTMKIIGGCNYTRYYCERCGEFIEEHDNVDTLILWTRAKTKTLDYFIIEDSTSIFDLDNWYNIPIKPIPFPEYVNPPILLEKIKILNDTLYFNK